MTLTSFVGSGSSTLGSPATVVSYALEFTPTTENFGVRWEMTSNRISPGSVAPVTTPHMASVRCGELPGMDRKTYDKRSFRKLPRERCEVEFLFGPAIGPCKGLIHLHHTDPDDPSSRTIQVCNSHHQRLHAALRALRGPEKTWKRCSHRHTTPEGRAACERRLNQQLTDAA